MSKNCLAIENGKLVRVLANGDLRVIGNAMNVEGIFRSVESGEIKIKLSFISDGEKQIVEILRGDITPKRLTKLTSYGADCWKENAKFYAQYIRDALDDIQSINQHKTIGWQTYKDKEVFNLYKSIGYESRYIGSYKLEPQGTFDEWKSMIKTEVIGNPWLELALAIGFTAPLIKIIKENSNMESLFVNFCGVSSCGKTTATRLALSPWGYPDKLKGGLMGSWYGTDQGILSTLAGNMGVPVAFDDTSTQGTGRNFSDFIYQVAEGVERSRLNAIGKKQERSEWATTIISSSEKSMFEGGDSRKGLWVRLIEVHEQMTVSSENAEAINNIVMKNYGHSGVLFIEYLKRLSRDKIVALWYIHKGKILKSLPYKDRLSERIAAKLAIVVVAAELANKAMNLDLDIKMLINSLVQLEVKNISARDNCLAAYNYVKDYFATNQGKFFISEDYSVNKNCIGKCILDSEGRVVELWFPTKELIAILEKRKFDAAQTIKDFKDRGLLKTDEGKNTLQRRFISNMPRISLYAIKIVDIATNNSNADSGHVA